MITLASAAAVVGPFVGHAFFPWPLFIFVPLFWIAVIVVLAVIFGRRRRMMWRNWQDWQTTQSSSGAESTLAERFAQGDIDEVEYRARLEVLRANRPAPQHPGFGPGGPRP